LAFIRLNYKSFALGMDTNVTLILPNGTRSCGAATEKYPLLWILHGGGGDDMEYIRNSYIQQYAEENGIAVAAIAGVNSCYMDTAYGQNYATMLATELPSLLYNRFPISSRREDNAITGFSMGAAGAVWAAVRRPENYGLCVAMSGMPDGIEDILDRKSYTPVRIPGQGGQVLDCIYGPTETLAGTENDFRHLCDVAAKKECGFPIFRMLHGSLDTRIDPRMRKYSALLSELGADVRSFDVFEGYAHEAALCDIGIELILTKWMQEIPGFRAANG